MSETADVFLFLSLFPYPGGPMEVFYTQVLGVLGVWSSIGGSGVHELQSVRRDQGAEHRGG